MLSQTLDQNNTTEPNPCNHLLADSATAPADTIDDGLADLDIAAAEGTGSINEMRAGLDRYAAACATPARTASASITLSGMRVTAIPTAASAPVAPAPADDKWLKQPEDLPDCHNLGGSTDKSVNSKRTISVFRDAEYMRNLKGFFDSAPIPAGTHSLVHKALLSSSHSSLSPLACESTRALLNHTTPKKPSWKVRKPWWDSMNGGEPLPPPARQYRAPAPWRDISDPLLVTYLHIALKTLGPVHTVNLNLSPEVEKQARAQAYPLGWLHRRVSYHLKQALGRPVELFLVPEECDQRRLHLHGEAQIRENEDKDARAGLCKAGGESDLPKQLQAWTEADPDRGWVDYLTLDMWRVGLTRNLLPRLTMRCGRIPSSAITFEGGTVCATKNLNAKAEAIYQQHRELVKSRWRYH
jgi:hypothetical protein